MASMKKHIKKNGEISYRIRVLAGTRPDGTQDVRSCTWVAPRGMSEAKADKEAERQKAKFEDDVYNGRIAEMHPKFSDMMSEYIKHLEKLNKHSEGTIDTYCGYQERINDSIGDMRVDKIEIKHVQQMIYNLADGNMKKGFKPLGEKTVKNYRSFVKRVLDYAYRTINLARINPAPYAEIIGKPSQEREGYSIYEVKTILNAITESSLATKYKLFVVITVFCGLRVGEVAGIRYSHIDGNTVYIEKQLRNTKKRGKQELRTKSPNSVRTIVLPEIAIELLERLKGEQIIEKAVLGESWKDDDFVFHNDRGDKMHPDYPRKVLSKFCEDYGLPYKALHSFRHTFCSELVDNEKASEISIKDVSKAAGHGDTAITERCYVHRNKKPVSKAFEVYERILVS